MQCQIPRRRRINWSVGMGTNRVLALSVTKLFIFIAGFDLIGRLAVKLRRDLSYLRQEFFDFVAMYVLHQCPAPRRELSSVRVSSGRRTLICTWLHCLVRTCLN